MSQPDPTDPVSANLSFYDMVRKSPEPRLEGFEFRPALNGPDQQPPPPGDPASWDDLPPAQRQRMAVVEKWDRRNLCDSTRAIVETSEEFLEIPDAVRGLGGFTVARTAPTIEFVVVPLKHRFLPKVRQGYYVGGWSNWGQGNFHPATGRFYGAIGNHRPYQAELHLLEYNPQSHELKVLPEINRLLGRGFDAFGDGKIHGRLERFGDSRLLFSPYWCHVPEPLDADFATGYEGSKILSFDVLTGELTDHGTPVIRSTWPYYALDRRKDLFYGAGMFGEFLCYDMAQERVRWAGFLPEESGIKWWNRAMLVDEATGCVYSSNMSRQDPQAHMLRFDPQRNRFYRMNCSVPPNEETGEIGQMRAHTFEPTVDGAYVGVAMGGQVFKFHPGEDRTESVALNWPGPHRYTGALAPSPDGRFVYYMPAAHGRAHVEGAPVVQMNVESGERKVIAFLFPALHEKYGYIPTGTFSVVLNETGDRLCIVMNGAFQDVPRPGESDDRGGSWDILWDPSVCVVHIPEEERR